MVISLVCYNILSDHFHTQGYLGWLAICIIKEHKSVYLTANFIVQQELQLGKPGPKSGCVKSEFYCIYLQETMALKPHFYTFDNLSDFF